LRVARRGGRAAVAVGQTCRALTSGRVAKRFARRAIVVALTLDASSGGRIAKRLAGRAVDVCAQVASVGLTIVRGAVIGRSVIAGVLTAAVVARRIIDVHCSVGGSTVVGGVRTAVVAGATAGLLRTGHGATHRKYQQNYPCISPHDTAPRISSVVSSGQLPVLLRHVSPLLRQPSFPTVGVF
jgi:hypothetical protein